MLTLALLGILTFSQSYGNRIIEDRPVTNWGVWGPFSRCPAGTFVTGFQLKVSDDQGRGDDVALDGICLYCNSQGDFNESNWITSTSSSFGSWREIFHLDGVMTGYQLRAERPSGSDDDTAANNLRVFTASANPDKDIVEGDGLYFGDWLPPQFCNPREAVCGLMTQVEPNIDGDNTALNNVKFECCNLPNPAEFCTPKDIWKLVGVCDNSNGKADLLCTYKIKYGISIYNVYSQKAYEATIFGKAGFDCEHITPFLAQNFRTNLFVSRVTGFKWNLESNPLTWSPETIHPSQYYTKPGMVSKLYQNVGRCGFYTVHSTGIKMTEFRAF